VERINSVEFKGCRAGSGRATWGQRQQWINLVSNSHDPRFNLPFAWKLGAEVSTKTVVVALRHLVERHDSLRTSFPDIDSLELQEQHVHSQGSIEVLINRQTARYDLTTVDDIMTETARAPFVASDGCLIRFCILEAARKPAWVVGTISHLAADAIALRILEQEFHSLALTGKPELGPKESWEPLDLAIYESSPEGRACHERAMAGWHSALELCPGVTFKARTATSSSFPSLELLSRDAGSTAIQLATTLRVTPSSIFLAALVRSLAIEAGADIFLAKVVYANRYYPHSRTYIGPLTQEAVIPVRDATRSLPDLSRAVWPRLLRGSRTSAYDPVELRALGAEIRGLGGPVVDHKLNLIEDNLRGFDLGGDGHQDTAYMIRHLDPPASSALTFFIQARYDTCHARFRMHADDRAVDSHAVERVLIRIADSLIANAPC